MKITYQWESFTNPSVLLLREKYKLEELVNRANDEFTKQLILKDWVYEILPFGYNIKSDYKNTLEILDDIKDGQFYCSHYALIFIQAGISLRWYTRKLGIDYDHKKGEEERHHGIADIWSNQFKKWYVVDAMHNLHFEKENIPLNAMEIRSEYLKNKAQDIEGVIGINEKRLKYGSDTFGFDQPSNYFWFFILLRNNFFTDPNMYNGNSLLWNDEYNENKIWYKGGGKKGEPVPHPQYKNQFIKTNDFDMCFPQMSQ
jgi:hypothetical protein